MINYQWTTQCLATFDKTYDSVSKFSGYIACCGVKITVFWQTCNGAWALILSLFIMAV